MVERPSLGQFEQLVLASVLEQHPDAYGVTVHRAVDRMMRPRSCRPGAVYATLDRLEDKGLLESWLSEPTAQRGGRAKRHYRLSSDGEEALREALTVADRLGQAVRGRLAGMEGPA